MHAVLLFMLSIVHIDFDAFYFIQFQLSLINRELYMKLEIISYYINLIYIANINLLHSLKFLVIGSLLYSEQGILSYHLYNH